MIWGASVGSLSFSMMVSRPPVTPGSSSSGRLFCSLPLGGEGLLIPKESVVRVSGHSRRQLILLLAIFCALTLLRIELFGANLKELVRMISLTIWPSEGFPPPSSSSSTCVCSFFSSSSVFFLFRFSWAFLLLSLKRASTSSTVSQRGRLLVSGRVKMMRPPSIPATPKVTSVTHHPKVDWKKRIWFVKQTVSYIYKHIWVFINIWLQSPGLITSGVFVLLLISRWTGEVLYPISIIASYLQKYGIKASTIDQSRIFLWSLNKTELWNL